MASRSDETTPVRRDTTLQPTVTAAVLAGASLSEGCFAGEFAACEGSFDVHAGSRVGMGATAPAWPSAGAVVVEVRIGRTSADVPIPPMTMSHQIGSKPSMTAPAAPRN